MSNISFENFGYIAKKVGFKNINISSSRHDFQQKYYPDILTNILKKLKINKHDVFLDIGCGLGLFLIPISFFCKSAYGLDHKNFIIKLKFFFKFFEKKNLLSGNFLKKKITIKFDKILIYSVLQYLANEKEFQYFVFKSINLLNKNGKVLLGDIPIYEYEHKYYNSLEGKRFKKFFLLSKSKSIQKGKKFGISDYLIKKKNDKKLKNKFRYN